jgi:hypothetical protein
MPVTPRAALCYLTAGAAGALESEGAPELLVPAALEPELGTAPGPDVAGVPGVPLEPGSFTVWGER